MSDVILRDIEFNEQLLENVSIFDEVLSKLDELPLFENQNFTVFSAFEVLPNYLLMETTNLRANTLPIMIWFEGNDLVIDIAGIRETFEWSKEQIEKDKNSVLELIRNLFTGYVLVDDKTSSKFIQIFDSSGDFVDCQSRNSLFHSITGRFFFRFKDYRKLYLPLFSKNDSE